MGSDNLPFNPTVLLVAVPTVASLGIIWPFCGALVRYRANYDGYPEDASLSVTMADHVSELIRDKSLLIPGRRLTGLWASLRRTWHLEGLGGFYKGELSTR